MGRKGIYVKRSTGIPHGWVEMLSMLNVLLVYPMGGLKMLSMLNVLLVYPKCG